MSKDRPKPVRLWPLAYSAGICWLVWALSVQFPFTWQPTDSLYASLQRGCVGMWYWAPAERSSLGIHDNLALSAQPMGPLYFTPFIWRDPWGFGLGIPLWIPAIILTLLVVRRYAITTVRDAPPITRRTRRWAVLWIFLWSVATLCFILSARHRSESLLTIGSARLSAENGALTIGRTEESLPPQPVSSASSRIVFTTTGSVAGFIPPSRQGALWLDLFPDLDLSTALWRIAFPLWPFVIGLSWLAWKAQCAAAYRGKGLCPACGYDLSGLAAVRRCPECGVALAPAVPDSLKRTSST